MQIYQLANDPATYGYYAGHYLIVTDDTEHELSEPMPTIAEAQRRLAWLSNKSSIPSYGDRHLIRRQPQDSESTESFLQTESLSQEGPLTHAAGKALPYSYVVLPCVVDPNDFGVHRPEEGEEPKFFGVYQRDEKGQCEMHLADFPTQDAAEHFIEALPAGQPWTVGVMKSLVDGIAANYPAKSESTSKRAVPPSLFPNCTDSDAPFDDYEVSGCREDENGSVEQCDDEEAQFFSLYGHTIGIGVTCIGDYATRKDAEHFEARIRGANLEAVRLIKLCREALRGRADWPTIEVAGELQAFIDNHAA